MPEDAKAIIYYANMKVMVDHNFRNGTDIKNKGGWPMVLVANDNINRYEMARLLHNIICYEGKQASTGEKNAAVAQIGNWAQVEKDIPKTSQVSVKNCYALGIITGMSDGSFAGKDMTRAQACTVMMRMLKLIKGYVPNSSTSSSTDNGNTYDNGKNQSVAALEQVENAESVMPEFDGIRSQQELQNHAPNIR